jgi:murein DD-endopeptidase MepM/ murein hydrolase activator NlpD
MNPKRFLVLFLLIGLLFMGVMLPVNANAAPLPQVAVASPTPGPDGRILYIVQPGDNCLRIAALNGISEQTLRQLNAKIDENCSNLQPGEQLLIGLAGAAAGTPTAGPSPTPLPPTASPTPFTGTTEICILLFDDINGDALRQETEPAVAGGAVSVTEIHGEYSSSNETVINPDPEAFQGICFTDVPEGTYNITVGIPDNYNATMSLDYTLEVKAGDRAFVDFGAQSKDVVVGDSTTEPDPSESRSPVLGILGGILLLGGGVLGYYAWRSGKPESKLSGGAGILKK